MAKCVKCSGPTGTSPVCLWCLTSAGHLREVVPQDEVDSYKALVKADERARGAAKDLVALFDAKFTGIGPIQPLPESEPFWDWPAEIRLADKDGFIGTAKLRKLPAAKDAKCSVNGAKDAERVYEARIGEGNSAQKLSYRLCLKHAVEWAALHQEA